MWPLPTLGRRILGTRTAHPYHPEQRMRSFRDGGETGCAGPKFCGLNAGLNGTQFRRGIIPLSIPSQSQCVSAAKQTLLARGPPESAAGRFHAAGVAVGRTAQAREHQGRKSESSGVDSEPHVFADCCGLGVPRAGNSLACGGSFSDACPSLSAFQAGHRVFLRLPRRWNQGWERRYFIGSGAAPPLRRGPPTPFLWIERHQGHSPRADKISALPVQTAAPVASMSKPRSKALH